MHIKSFIKGYIEKSASLPYKRRIEAIGIDEDGNVLMGRRPGNPWVFPGGGIEDEPGRKAANREFMEEVGYSLKNIKKAPVKPLSFKYDKSDKYGGALTDYYIGKIKGKDLSLYGNDNDTFDKVKLFSLDKAIKMMTRQSRNTDDYLRRSALKKLEILNHLKGSK
jgi:8-oxo-dGTP pyrophosphatase MutT (NUDIX family)